MSSSYYNYSNYSKIILITLIQSLQEFSRIFYLVKCLEILTKYNNSKKEAQKNG